MNNEQLLKRIEKLEAENNKLRAEATIPLEVDRAFRGRFGILVGAEFLTSTSLFLLIPSDLQTAPLSSITAPTGGGTQDAEARTAINTIITRLESLGLVDPN